MKIKIDTTDKARAKFEAALDETNGKRGLEHGFRSTGDLVTAISIAEKRLRYLPKKYWSGITIRVSSGAALPNAYKYRRTVNVATIERSASTWYLVGLEKCKGGNSEGKITILMSQEQSQKMMEKFFLDNRIEVREGEGE